MHLISPSFKLCEEILEYFTLYSADDITENKIVYAIAKTPSYVKKALNFLRLCGIIIEENEKLKITDSYIKFLSEGTIDGVIKIGITNQVVFKEFYRLKNSGKSLKQSAQYVIALYRLSIDVDKLIKVMEDWTKYLKTEIKNSNKNTQVEVHGFMWVNEMGELIYDEKAHTEFIVDQIKKENKDLGEGSVFVDPERIEQLKKINNLEFDLTKLVRKCIELNVAYSTKCYFSVGMLTRAIIDHVPPIFNKTTFTDVAGGHGSKSFKDSMIHLDKSSRKIADSFLHTHIRKKEILPTKTQVNFSSDLDVLLGEIIRVLS
ncbi:hypothetical protein [Flavobacterium sp. NRK1]|uniref:hypothetical protein n=1 Tax=Flavobacterium sp. NRK1 TaxID=2954929 RepID=UPI0020938766|nr:hypothetical protein [Flavobacterium sp. NRK1]MCO6149538.1 hypothetical protein [Flavobacterium sp. NRK1]